MKDTEFTVDEGWPAAIGAVIIVGLFLTLGLVAAGGWPWFQRFLESSAAAWIQAIGSIAASWLQQKLVGDRLPGKDKWSEIVEIKKIAKGY